MLPHFFSQRIRVNCALRSVIMLRVESVRNGMPNIFQQDYAPPHKAKLAKERMAENFYDHVTTDIGLLAPQTLTQ